MLSSCSRQPAQTGCELWRADTHQSCPSTEECSRFYFEVSQRKRGDLSPPPPFLQLQKRRRGSRSRSASLRVRNWWGKHAPLLFPSSLPLINPGQVIRWSFSSAPVQNSSFCSLTNETCDSDGCGRRHFTHRVFWRIEANRGLNLSESRQVSSPPTHPPPPVLG